MLISSSEAGLDLSDFEAMLKHLSFPHFITIVMFLLTILYYMMLMMSSGEAGLDLSDFEAMLKHLSPIRYPAGAFVFREGDPPDGLYFITSGKVEYNHT